MKNMKTWVAILMAASVLSLSACGNSQPADEEELAGAFTDEDTTEIPEEAQEAFDKAYEGFDGEITLISYQGTQVVAGTNYKFLANVNGKEMEIIVYRDLDDNCTLYDSELEELSK